MTVKQASSEASWALLTEGVTAARLEVHRLRHLIRRGLQVVDTSSEKEHIHQVAGDLLQAVPKRISELERILDRTSLALAKMGEDFLSSRLSLSDKQHVEDAVESTGGFKKARVEHVAALWLRSSRDTGGWHHPYMHLGERWTGMISELQQYAGDANIEAENAKDALGMGAYDSGYEGDPLPKDWVLLGRKIGVNVKKEWEAGRKDGAAARDQY